MSLIIPKFTEAEKAEKKYFKILKDNEVGDNKRIPLKKYIELRKEFFSFRKDGTEAKKSEKPESPPPPNSGEYLAENSDILSYRDIKKNFISLFEKAEKNSLVEGFDFDPDVFAYVRAKDKVRVVYDFDAPEITKNVFDPTGKKIEAQTFKNKEELQNEIDEFLEIIGIDKGIPQNSDHVVDDHVVDKSQISSDESGQEELNKKLFEEVSKNPADLEKIENLYHEGAQINTYFSNGTKDEKTTPLHLAIANGDIEVARFLIERHADLNAPEKNAPGKGFCEQNTPLHLAAAGRPELLELLIENGAEVDKANYYGFTPLMRSCMSPSSGSKECLEILLKNGADPHLTQKDGSQAIHWAALMEEKDKIKILVDYGANINTRDVDDERPIDCAKIGNPKQDFIDFMINLGSFQEGQDHEARAAETNLFDSLSQGAASIMSDVITTMRQNCFNPSDSENNPSDSEKEIEFKNFNSVTEVGKNGICR